MKAVDFWYKGFFYCFFKRNLIFIVFMVNNSVNNSDILFSMNDFGNREKSIENNKASFSLPMENRNKKSVILPKATAMWLVDNTALTFQQIADFCSLHFLEVVAMANGECSSIKPLSPIANGQLTQKAIDHYTMNPEQKIDVCQQKEFEFLFEKKKGSRYVSRRKRRDKPDAILWLLNNHSDFEVNDICKLINTTKNVVTSIMNKTHWNYNNLEAKDPVLLDLCSQENIDSIKIKKEIVRARNKHVFS